MRRTRGSAGGSDSGRAAGIAVLLLSAGLVQFVFGSLVRRLRVFFPPEVCGVVVLILGVSMVPHAFERIVDMPAAAGPLRGC